MFAKHGSGTESPNDMIANSDHLRFHPIAETGNRAVIDNDETVALMLHHEQPDVTQSRALFALIELNLKRRANTDDPSGSGFVPLSAESVMVACFASRKHLFRRCIIDWRDGLVDRRAISQLHHRAQDRPERHVSIDTHQPCRDQTFRIVIRSRAGSQ
jgi:hypothetical protein